MIDAKRSRSWGNEKVYYVILCYLMYIGDKMPSVSFAFPTRFDVKYYHSRERFIIIYSIWLVVRIIDGFTRRGVEEESSTL